MLDPDQQQRLRSLFAEVVEQPESERAAFVARECADAPAIRRELESMLDVHVAGDSRFLETPLLDSGADLPTPAPLPSIDGFEQIESIAEGGMGTVFKAQQTHPVRRTVALKIIKKGMDSDAVLRRFEAERQAMALMSHPYIATVHDAGTDSEGRPFIAMEFVPGRPITGFCDAEQLALEARLELLVKVCHAVEHAHRRGVLHRDLKPSNVLVSRNADEVAPKVIDFGIAKALQGPLGEQSIHTERGSFLGTPEYMSPEQVDGFAEQIDTRSDVYSLGVILYELLTSELPFASEKLRQASLSQLSRIVHEEVPPKPSTRLRVGPAAARNAKKSDTTRWQRRLAGDLDWIAMKALEKDPDRRYGTPREFALDLENFLHHRPVSAGPPSGAYRLRKFVRRYRVQVAAAALVLVSLVVGLFGTLWFLFEANERATESEIARKNAEGSRLATEAFQQAEENPGLALLLALEADSLTDEHNKFAARNAIYRTLPQHRELRRLIGHDLPIHQLLFHSDGRRLVSRGGDTIAALWDADSGRLLRRFVGHTQRLTRIDIDPMGQRLLTTSWDRSARVFDLETGKVELVLRGHEERLDFGAFSPDGTRIATASRDHTARIFDARSGRELHVLAGHEQIVSCLAFDSTGQRLVTRSFDGTARVWDVETGELERVFTGYLRPGANAQPKIMSEVQKLLFQPGGDRFVTFSSRIGGKHEVRVDAVDEELAWRIPDGRSPAFLERGALLLVPRNGGMTAQPSEYEGLTYVDLDMGDQQRRPDRARIYINAVSPNERYAAFTTADYDIELVDLVRQQSIGFCRGHANNSLRYAAAFNADGDRLATGSNLRGQVKLWQTVPDYGAVDLAGQARIVLAHLATTADGNYALIEQPNDGRSVWRVVDLDTLQQVCSIDDPRVAQVHLAPDARHLLGVVLRPDNGQLCERVIVFDAAGQEVRSFEMTDPVDRSSLRFRPDGAAVAYMERPESESREFVLHDLESPSRTRSLGAAFTGTLEWSRAPKSSRVAAIYHNDSRTDVLDAASGAVLKSIPSPIRVTHMRAAFSPDERYLLLVLANRRAQIWDLTEVSADSSARLVAEYDNLLSTPRWCGFAARGTLAWVACNDEVHLFDALTAEPFAVLKLGNQVADVRVTADDATLLTLTINGTLQRWPLDPIAVAEQRAQGQLERRELETYRIGTPAERLRREREFLRSHPTARNWERLAELDRDAGDLDGAIRGYRAACDLGPHRPNRNAIYVELLKLSCQRLAEGGRDDAEQHADRNYAFEALGQAIRCGVPREELLALPDIQVLRADPRFAELMGP